MEFKTSSIYTFHFTLKASHGNEYVEMLYKAKLINIDFALSIIVLLLRYYVITQISVPGYGM
jgi:hypothetical protein